MIGWNDNGSRSRFCDNAVDTIFYAWWSRKLLCNLLPNGGTELPPDYNSALDLYGIFDDECLAITFKCLHPKSRQDCGLWSVLHCARFISISYRSNYASLMNIQHTCSSTSDCNCVKLQHWFNKNREQFQCEAIQIEKRLLSSGQILHDPTLFQWQHCWVNMWQQQNKQAWWRCAFASCAKELTGKIVGIHRVS